ncbi:hypothetical protein [Dysgonomonas macrotermitis]|uniref:Uncharacterized protein n=1 Tax=Dysgonomonas macrotermitis TaxID=1346286 RepID=A0A1M5FJS3_9BACT|nr:hypothetical protein [Dysgonomonas macrotermitis]SHF91728.1 hypothetical protein SAMN05444362_11220 [Dysgonomonas macrotermitis]
MEFLFIILILMIQSAVCILDFMCYYCTKKRFHFLITIPIELISFLLIPALAILFEFTKELEQTITVEAFYSISVLCIIFYFVSTYFKNVFSLLTESLFFIFILAGWVFNIIITILLISKTEHLEGLLLFILFIGSTPIFFLLTRGLIKSGKRCSKAYKWNKFYGTYSNL